MEGTHGSRTVVDIAATAKKWPQIIPILPAIHALTGFDTTSRVFGIGKKTALKQRVNKLGDKFASMDEVTEEATAFIGTCYGTLDGFDMTGKRLTFIVFVLTS